MVESFTRRKLEESNERMLVDWDDNEVKKCMNEVSLDDQCISLVGNPYKTQAEVIS